MPDSLPTLAQLRRTLAGEDRRYQDMTYDRKRAADPVLAMANRIRHSTRWRRVRERVLAEEPTCRVCREQGLDASAVEVDHIVGLAVRPDLAFVRTNLQPLCTRCHRRKEANVRTGGRVPKGMKPPQPMTTAAQQAKASTDVAMAARVPLSRELRQGTLHALELKPGDVVVYLHPKPLAEVHTARLESMLAMAFPGHRCMVLDDGASLTVARPEQAPPSSS